MSQDFSRPGKAPTAIPGKLPVAIESVRNLVQPRLEAMIGDLLGRSESIVFEWSQTQSPSEQQHSMDIIIEAVSNWRRTS